MKIHLENKIIMSGTHLAPYVDLNVRHATLIIEIKQTNGKIIKI